MAVASLVLGIISLAFCFMPGFNFIAPIVGIIGIVLAAISKKQLEESKQPSGMATGGLVTSIIGTALGGIIYLACAVCAGGTGLLLKEAVKEIQKDPKKFEQSIKDLEKLGRELEKKSKEEEKK